MSDSWWGALSRWGCQKCVAIRLFLLFGCATFYLNWMGSTIILKLYIARGSETVDPQSRSYKVVGRGATKRRVKHLNFTRYYVTLVLKGLMNVDRTRQESIVAKQNRDPPSSFACIPIILVPLGKVNLVTVYQCALSSPMEFPSACAEHRLSQVIFAVISAAKNSV